MKKILVVGQGIAGTVLAWTLQKHGAEVTMADAGLPNSASLAAAGIINPVTGKRYAKSWMIDELLPFARKFYADLEVEFEAKIWHPRNIIRLLSSVEEENNWSLRCGLPDFQDYIETRQDAGDWTPHLKPSSFFGAIKNAAQVDFPTLLRVFRKRWIEKGLFFQHEISPQIVDKFFSDFDFLIFCEGFRGKENPFFPEKAWLPAKGEALFIRFDDHRFEPISQMLKKKIMLVPIAENLFWAGSNYQWDFTDMEPTEEGKSFIVNELESMLRVPFSIVSHHAAVRPTVKDRRPVIGLSAKNPRIGIFNGLGTKGTLLAPFWAEHFAQHLLHEQPLSLAVDVARNRG